MRAVLSSLGDFVRKHPLFSIIIGLLIGWIFFVRIYNSINLDPGHIRISTTQETFKDLVTEKTGRDIGEAAHFATLSAEVYGTVKPDGEIVLDWQNDKCRQQTVLDQWTWLPPPPNLSTSPDNNDEEKASWDSDLVFGLWQRKPLLPDGKTRAPRQVALVFRGTHQVGDFWSNFRWVTRLFGLGWDQYDLTRKIVLEIEDHIEKTLGKGTEIIAAGHSLGGGLAHQAAYASKKINRVYSFNGTSVTGFYSVDAEWRNERKKDIRIYRMHEKGEVLNILRGLMRLIYPVTEVSPQIVDATYNFGIGSLIKQHSIESLSCALVHHYK